MLVHHELANLLLLRRRHVDRGLLAADDCRPRLRVFAVVENGRRVTPAEIARDVGRLFSENFLKWTGRSSIVAAAPAV